jgi:small multidrug resistance family-3 protein
MDVVRVIAILTAAALGELGGTYAIWRWRRLEGPAVLMLVGILALLAYALVQTFQSATRYGRIYAAYAGVFLVGAMLWGWAFDGRAPDRFDWIGAGLALLGAATILWGRTLFTR